jgi:hypothetical protein
MPGRDVRLHRPTACTSAARYIDLPAPPPVEGVRRARSHDARPAIAPFARDVVTVMMSWESAKQRHIHGRPYLTQHGHAGLARADAHTSGPQSNKVRGAGGHGHVLAGCRAGAGRDSAWASPHGAHATTRAAWPESFSQARRERIFLIARPLDRWSERLLMVLRARTTPLLLAAAPCFRGPTRRPFPKQ